MLLKRLELVGFKSFREKTVIELPTGITAVVGPNGSGKSNIIDAIRWILGEREAKNLRSLKVDDLIFGGSGEKARSGLAQVSMSFNNESGFFPVDFAEITVTRRMHRDGTGEFLLNNSECRLKDIIDFFAKSRLGTRGLTIVNQGESDLFVRATPRERREMVEEILGLRQYQIKKHEAELKLNHTEINLSQAQSHVEELLPHLKLLRKQTSKWERHDEIVKELRELENNYFAFKLREIEEGSGKLEAPLQALDEKIAARKGELEKIQAQLKKLEESRPRSSVEIASLEKRRKTLQEELFKVQRELSKIEARLEIQEEKSVTGPVDGGRAIAMIREIKDAIDEILEMGEVETIIVRLRQIKAGIEKLLGGSEKKTVPSTGPGQAAPIVSESDRKKLQESFAKIEAEIKAVDERQKMLTASLGDYSGEFQKMFESLEAKKDETAALEKEKANLNFERERFGLRLEEIKHRIAESERTVEEFLAVSVFREVTPEFLGDAERRMFRLRGELAAMGEVDPAVMQEADEAEKRYEFFKTQIEDLTKSSKDLKELIKELSRKIHSEFSESLKKINDEFNTHFRLMFGGGHAKLKMEIYTPPEKTEGREETEGGGIVAETEVEEIDEEKEELARGIEVDVSLASKGIKGIDMLSGGEKSLVSIAALFALVSVSPPPFLVLDEIDAALDEKNSKRFAELVKNFSKKSQFIIVTHNRAVMEVAETLYGVTMGGDGISKVLSLRMT